MASTNLVINMDCDMRQFERWLRRRALLARVGWPIPSEAKLEREMQRRIVIMIDGKPVPWSIANG